MTKTSFVHQNSATFYPCQIHDRDDRGNDGAAVRDNFAHHYVEKRFECVSFTKRGKLWKYSNLLQAIESICAYQFFYIQLVRFILTNATMIYSTHNTAQSSSSELWSTHSIQQLSLLIIMLVVLQWQKKICYCMYYFRESYTQVQRRFTAVNDWIVWCGIGRLFETWCRLTFFYESSILWTPSSAKVLTFKVFTISRKFRMWRKLTVSFFGFGFRRCNQRDVAFNLHKFDCCRLCFEKQMTSLKSVNKLTKQIKFKHQICDSQCRHIHKW